MRAITIEADDEIVTLKAGERNHSFKAGDQVEFIRLAGGTGLTGRAASANLAQGASGSRLSSGKPTRYFVIASGLTNRAFKVSATLGGSAVNVTADATAGYVRRAQRVPGDV